MNQDEIKTNLLDADQWIRMLFMAVFAVAAWLILLGLILLVLVQTLIMLVSGEPNRNLQKAGYLFACYLQEIIQFLLYNTNKKPFPFSDFPSAAEAEESVVSQTGSAPAPEAGSPASGESPGYAADDNAGQDEQDPTFR